MIRKFFFLALISLAATFQFGCGALSGSILGPSDTATVISKTAQIRTSYSVVAADLLEVKRNDRLEVIDETAFPK